MTETALPLAAAEGATSLDAAASAFKIHLGQAAQPERARDEQGRFAAPERTEEEEIETEGAADDAAETVTNDAEGEQAEEAGAPTGEPQPDPVALPASWSKDDSGLWSSLPAEAQAKIAAREAQRDAAVGQKFQEAANVRKANEGLVAEAHANRHRYAEAVDQVLSLVQPRRPDPKEYFTEQGFDQASYAIAQHEFEQSSELVHGLAQQRRAIAAQQAREAEESEAQALAAINQAAAPRFVSDVPDLTDPAKGSELIGSVVRYAIAQGIPAEMFAPENMKRVSLAELHLAWKAQAYDAMKAAQAKVAATPKPEAKTPSPAIRPGVATPRGAAERLKFSGAMDRLAKSGSVADGAAVLKQMFKGQ
jgi:hypothetical protein